MRVRVLPRPPSYNDFTSKVNPNLEVLDSFRGYHGPVAQLGERLFCKQEVTGSIPVRSTIYKGVPNEIQRFGSR